MKRKYSQIMQKLKVEIEDGRAETLTPSIDIR